MISRYFSQRVLLGMTLLMATSIKAHDDKAHSTSLINNPRGVEELNFNAQHIKRVITAGYPASFGVFAFSRRKPTEYITVNDDDNQSHHCVKANFIGFDIDDSYAFDINEDVSIAFLIDRSQTSSLVYGFDQVANEKANYELSLIDSDNHHGKLVWVSATLNNARFANRGINSTDLVITTNETMQDEHELAENTDTRLVLCDVKISRSNAKSTTSALTTNVDIRLKFLDENGETPVRLGLYDSDGAAVLIDKQMLKLPFYEDKSQHFSVPAYYPPYQFWPHNNRYYNYVDGRVRLTLKPDTYTLIATKGPEYRISKTPLVVSDRSDDAEIVVPMKRWKNLPSQGWFSGDVHVHIAREQKDNENLVKVFKAEDLHFTNLLAMSTLKNDYFAQFDYGKKGTFTKENFHIISGVEGPRTAFRGHAIALNIHELYRQPGNFFLYDKYFDFYRKQDAVIGYAHVGSKEFNASLGLALDVPYGLVDFVEIMQNQRIRTEFWYEFLNIGFKLAPAAGSDYPYFEQPGAVRSYVKLNTKTLQHQTSEWFQQLKQGNTFVSNLPFIEFSINNNPIGSRLALTDNQVLHIAAKAMINTDYDRLAEITLIHCGNEIKQFKADETLGESLSFNVQIEQKDSGWYALSVKGKDYALAHSGAIYLEDEQGNSRCKHEASAVLDIMEQRLTKLSESTPNISKELEYWESTHLMDAFNQQKQALNNRITVAKSAYQKIKQQLDNNGG